MSDVPREADAVPGTATGPASPIGTVLILGANAQSLWNFRGPLIRALVAAGARVVACAPDLDASTRSRIHDLGAEPVEVDIDRSGTNPVRDLRTLVSLTRLLRQRRPMTFIGYTVKPVGIGTLAAALAGVRNRVALIEGLGFAFGRDTLRQRLLGVVVRTLYWIALRVAHTAAFLNEDDRGLFVRLGLVDPRKAIIVDGTGIDLDHYPSSELPSTPPFTFALIARLLYDKGLREYAQAAREVRQRYPDTRFLLAGPEDTNPAAIPLEVVRGWSDVLEYVGPVDDVRPILRSCHVYTLPSYREGVPRTVLEAMSMGRPIIVADAPGCRVTISQRHRNGLLVTPRDAHALAEAMIWMIEHREGLAEMGRASRRYAEERFEATRVTEGFIRRARILGPGNAPDGTAR